MSDTASLVTEETLCWTVGDVRITRVVEWVAVVDLQSFLPTAGPDAVARHEWLRPDWIDDRGRGHMSMHGLVVDTGERRILVDTCVGAMREGIEVPPRPSPWLDRLTAAGYGGDRIDTVLCTHLHFDHVGWNTHLVDGEWVPTFPNARYLFGRVEWDHWKDHDDADVGDVNLGDTVRPVVAAGLVDLVETDHRLCDEVRLVPTPGHTPGHVSVVVESRGERAVITGDVAHHPVQFAEPDIGMRADDDGAQAVVTRRAFLADRAADGSIVIGTHFGGASAGRVIPEGDAWRFQTEPPGPIPA
jgi:glyoxylase-like metal-dependent hydrolase (beta-lactamase superfamily II)